MSDTALATPQETAEGPWSELVTEFLGAIPERIVHHPSGGITVLVDRNQSFLDKLAVKLPSNACLVSFNNSEQLEKRMPSGYSIIEPGIHARQMLHHYVLTRPFAGPRDSYDAKSPIDAGTSISEITGETVHKDFRGARLGVTQRCEEPTGRMLPPRKRITFAHESDRELPLGPQAAAAYFYKRIPICPN